MTFGVFSERACSVRMIPSSQAGDILGLWIRPGLGIGGGRTLMRGRHISLLLVR